MVKEGQFPMEIEFPWTSLALSAMMLSFKMSLFSLKNSSLIRYHFYQEWLQLEMCKERWKDIPNPLPKGE
jgi:hypothetical protein